MSVEPTGSHALDRILLRLERVRKVAARGWVAACPAHNDSTPSLSLTIGSEGRVLMLCRANCPTESVLAAVGLGLADLYEPTAERRLVATYDYRDPQGALLYQVCRYDPKDFRVRRPVPGGWSWSLGDTARVPYRLPDLIATAAGDLVLVVEGEKDADRLAAMGLAATTNLGGAGKWRREYNEPLRDRDVVVIPDNDTAGVRHAREVARVLTGVASIVRIVTLPGLPAKGDVCDWLDAGGTRDDLIVLIEATAVVGQAGGRDMDATDRSAASHLPPSSAGGPLIANLAETLDALVAHLTRFIHFSRPEHAHAVALWAAHTHTRLDRLAQSPVLAITSPVKQSGKTRLLDVLEPVVHKPWRIARPSEAVLFRKIDRDHPTILLDEIDAIFNDRGGNTEGIRALFDSGNRHGTKVPRTAPQGRGHTLVEFDVFCPKATAGIGGLPDTILDRAIVIPMERRARSERVERLRDRQARALGAPIHDALAAHVGQIDDFTIDDASLPMELDERAQDGWEPLFAIAAVAGGRWPSLARRAALAIFGARRPADDNLEIRLLMDCRHVFSEFAGAFVSTQELRESLLAIDDAPWADIRGKAITPNYLGKLLGRFGVRSKRHRPFGTGNPIHGYFRADFEDPWLRYLEAPGANGTSGTSGTADALEASHAGLSVPVVSVVPDPGLMAVHAERDFLAVALDVFGDDLDWMPGLA